MVHTEAHELRDLPDDDSFVEIVIKLPCRRRLNVEFRASDRVGLVMTLLHGRGWDMGEHRLYRESDGSSLVDFSRLQDEGIRSGDILALEPLRR